MSVEINQIDLKYLLKGTFVFRFSIIMNKCNNNYEQKTINQQFQPSNCVHKHSIKTAEEFFN